MPRREKPIPRSQRIRFQSWRKISRNSPDVKDDVKKLYRLVLWIWIVLLYYFNEVIKPEVEVNKEKVKVPCFTHHQKDGMQKLNKDILEIKKDKLSFR